MIISDREFETTELIPTRATQGKTWRGNEDCCAAAHAIDQDPSTKAVTHTDNESGWLKIELDRSHYVRNVVIYYKFYNSWYHSYDACVQTEENFVNCVNDDLGGLSVSVYQEDVVKKSCDELNINYGLDKSDQIYELPCNVVGDSVKLSKSRGNIVVFEVAVTSKGTVRFETSSL